MQYGKVEICGVNTSQLKLLKESEKRELLNIIKNKGRKVEIDLFEAAKRKRQETR